VDPEDIPEARIIWLQPGDIIVVRSGAYTGDSATIPVEIGKCIAGFDMVLQCNSVNAKFVQYALLSNYLKNAQIDLEKMRAAQPHLNSVELGNCVLLAPPLVEQSAIVAFLDAETARIDGLIQEAEIGINLLRERRTTLISDAVTGKIDVRDWKEAM
jgi:Restriction endonuclease S subunits